MLIALPRSHCENFLIQQSLLQFVITLYEQLFERRW